MVIVAFHDVIVLENLRFSFFSILRRLRFPRISFDANYRNKASFFQFLQRIVVVALVNNRISAFNMQKTKNRQRTKQIDSGATLRSCRLKVGDGEVLCLS